MAAELASQFSLSIVSVLEGMASSTRALVTSLRQRATSSTQCDRQQSAGSTDRTVSGTRHALTRRSWKIQLSVVQRWGGSIQRAGQIAGNLIPGARWVAVRNYRDFNSAIGNFSRRPVLGLIRQRSNDRTHLRANRTPQLFDRHAFLLNEHREHHIHIVENQFSAGPCVYFCVSQTQRL